MGLEIFKPDNTPYKHISNEAIKKWDKDKMKRERSEEKTKNEKNLAEKKMIDKNTRKGVQGRFNVTDLSRRDFLRGAVAVATVAATAKYAKFAEDNISSFSNSENNQEAEESIGIKEGDLGETNFDDIKSDIGEEEVTSIEEAEKAEEAFESLDTEIKDVKYGSIEEMCRLKVDEKTSFKKDELLNFYKKHYATKGRDDLINGFVRMKELVDVEKLKSIFVEEGVPEELIYIAMTETYWNPNNIVSNKNAVGFWQFLEGTGRQYGLKIDSQVDERKDPLLAGRACAKYLRDLYDNYGQDWELAVNKYNSGYPARYKEYSKEVGEKMSYEKFLSFMERRYDHNKMIISSEGEYFNHKVKRGDTLGSISRKYSISLHNLLAVNPGLKKNGKIRLGQKLNLPVKDYIKNLVSKEKFKEWDYKEAIGYTPNVLAVIAFSKDKDFLAKVEDRSNKKFV